MKEQINFQIERQEKEKVFQVCKKLGMSFSNFARMSIIRNANQELLILQKLNQEELKN